MPLISLVLFTPTAKFSICILPVSLHLLFKFLSFYSFVSEFPYRLSSANIPVYYIPVLFQSWLFPYPFHLSPSFFLFPGSSFPCSVYTFFTLFPLLPETRHAGAISEMELGSCQYVVHLRRSCSYRLSPFSSAVNLASLSTQLYSSQNSNPYVHVCTQFTCLPSICSVLPLLSLGYFPLLIFPNPNFPGSPHKRVCSTRRHLELRRICRIVNFLILQNV